MMRRNARLAFVASLCAVVGVSAPALAQGQTSDADDPNILVEAERKLQEKEIRTLAREVTGYMRSNRPIPRFHGKMCLVIGGVNEALIDSFGARVIENAEFARVPVAQGDCKANALVIFTDNSREELAQLRKKKRWIFGNVNLSTFKKMLKSRDEAFVWKETVTMGLNNFSFDFFDGELPVNRTTIDGGGRITSPIKIDVRTAVVVIDKAAVEGMTAVQLADYASLRLLTPTQEVSELTDNAPATIMTLFKDTAGAPPEMTPFDLAYLRGVYQIAPNVAAHNVYWRTIRNLRDDKQR